MSSREPQFQSLLEKLPAAAYACDRDGRITYFNPQAARLWGRSPRLDDPRERFCGSHRIFSPEGSPIPHEQGVVALALSTGRELHGEEMVIERPDGRRLTVLANVQPIRDEAGELVGAVAVLVDISDRTAAAAELTRAKEAAERANRAKSEFLSHMSHEIRTPMSGVLGMAELLLGTALSPQQRRYADGAKDAAQALLGVINDVLDLAKIEAGHVELETVPFSLADLLDQALRTLALEAQSKGLDLVAGVDPDVPDRLIGDPTRLRQILVNLIGNATKFTESGSIVLRVAKEEEARDRIRLQLSVADTGIGIPPGQQRRIFEPFAQAEIGTRRRYGGTGLGLPICARLAALMNGALWVDSQPGRGSTFYLSAELRSVPEVRRAAEATPLRGIPILVAEHHPEQRRVLGQLLAAWAMRPTLVEDGRQALSALRQAGQRGEPFALLLLDFHLPGMGGFAVAEELRKDGALKALRVIAMLNLPTLPVEARQCAELQLESYLTKPIAPSELQEAILGALGIAERAVQTPPVPSPPPARRLRVLLVEDNPINRIVAVAQLEASGHEVVAAGNGEEAVRLFHDSAFDLLLMDVQMPTMDGLEATRLIRSLERERGAGHVPIIAMTAQALSGDREECLAAGMDHYITKPFQTESLLAAIEAFCGPVPQLPPPVAAPSPSLPPARSH
jgi:two-component system, sensor histidine kinase and response regulator